MMSKTDGGVVEILNKFTLVGTCIVMNKAAASWISCMFAFLMFYFSF